MDMKELHEKAIKDYGNLILEIVKTDPKFKEQFLQELNKKNDPDEIHILMRPVNGHENEDRIGDYIITTVKRTSKVSSIPKGELYLNEKLLKDLFQQLKELNKEGDLE
jgi:hypothetical protein